MSRILLHSLVFSPDGVSTAQIMADLAASLQSAGHEVTVLTTTPHYNVDETAVARQPIEPKRLNGRLCYSEYHGIPVWHVRLAEKRPEPWRRVIDFLCFHFWSLVAAYRVIPRQDIVISTSPPLTIGIVAWLIARRWGALSIYKVAEIYPDLAISQGVIRHPWAIAALRWIERLIYRKSDAVVTIAEQFSAIVTKRERRQRNVVMIPDFVDTDFFTPQPRRNAFSESQGLSDRFVVLYAGNIGLVQDWEGVLAAAAMLQHLPITFAIIGDGVRRAWVQSELQSRQLHNVKLIPYQSRDLMPLVNATADVAIIPMTRIGASDGFPSKVYSTMACGRSMIVGTGTESEMAALVARAECGRAVTPEDPHALARAIRACYENQEELQAEGARGRAFVERNYSKMAVAAQYEQLIARLKTEAGGSREVMTAELG